MGVVILQTDIVEILRKVKDIMDALDQRLTTMEEKTLNASNSTRYDISMLNHIINDLEEELRSFD